jgi:hypothetical protein
MPGGAEGQQRMHPTAVITMDKGGDPDRALSGGRAEDGREFHHAQQEGVLRRAHVPSRRRRLVAQGGDPKGDGTGGPGYSLKAEFNKRKHVRGTVAMARSSLPDSAGSQFYICFAPAPHLDNNHRLRPGDLGSDVSTASSRATR